MKYWFGLVVLLFANMVMPMSAQADLVTIKTFGMHMHSLARGGAWPTVPFGFLRLWDTDTTWRDLEPKAGHWQFDVLDTYVQAALAHEVELVMTLGQTPLWAAANKRAESPYGPGASSPPRNLADWRLYVETLGKRYKGKIRYWEIWNEVNVSHFWSGDFEVLAEMERIAAATLKEIDAQNVILTASMQGASYGKLNEYFTAGGGLHADVISYHFYVPQGNPEDIAERIRKVRSVMRQHGFQEKPLWNTEIGWLIENEGGGLGNHWRPAWASWNILDYEEAAAIVLRTFLINLANNVDHVFWYAWDNQAMGLSEKRGHNPKPASVGYARAVEWLLNSEVRYCKEKSSVWLCELSRGEGTERIIWSKKHQKFTLPLSWNVSEVIQLNGTIWKTKGRVEMAVGPNPKLLR